jgi:hypothetical protein
MGGGVSVAAEVDLEEGERKLEKRANVMQRKVVVLGAGTLEANGIYTVVPDSKNPNDPLIRNEAWMFRNKKNFTISREIIDGDAGWIIGKVPTAYYGIKDNSLLPPSEVWAGGGQFAGDLPFASVQDDVENEFTASSLPSLPKLVSRGARNNNVRIVKPPPKKLDLDKEQGEFYPVSPQRQRNKAWSTPNNTDRNMKLGMGTEMIDKENLRNFTKPSMNRSQQRKGKRYDYYQRRLKLRSENTASFDSPQRVDPNVFI